MLAISRRVPPRDFILRLEHRRMKPPNEVRMCRAYRRLNAPYLEIDRLNILSIFSLVASTALWAAWAAASA